MCEFRLTSPDEEQPEVEHKEKNEPVKKPFNPLSTYIYVVASIFAAYTLLYLFGYIILTVFMLFFVVNLTNDTSYILSNYPYSFVRKVAYFNIANAVISFIILAVNSFTFYQYGVHVILPEFDTLTFLCPLFILMGVFGSINLKKMYASSSEAALYSQA